MKLIKNLIAFYNPLLNQAKVFFICTLIIVFLHSCRKNPCSDGDVVNKVTLLVPDSEKQNIPFSGNDTLIYFSDAGDTAKLYGQGINTYFTDFFKQEGTLECPKGTKYENENIKYRFNGINNELGQITYTVRTNELEENYIDYSINQFVFTSISNHMINPYYYRDSILIGTKIIHVAKHKLNNSNIEVLFNCSYGIVQIKFLGSKSWLLKT